jgi:mRNA interferase MazF
MVSPRRFDVYLVALDPTQGAEIKKTRPCVVVSPDEANRIVQTVVVAPMTTTIRRFPFRIDMRFENRDSQIAIDQIRVVDRRRMHRRLGAIPDEVARRLAATLVEFFEFVG